MKKPLLIAVLFLSFSIILLGTGCKKTATPTDPPTITTADVILDVTTTSAQSGGTVTSIGSGVITAVGICYSTTNHLPTVSDTKATAVITNSYTYVSNLTGLTPNTTYYVRAYASNAYGTSYGSAVKFTTSGTLNAVTGEVTTFAGSGADGFADGTGTAAQFNNPIGVAVDAQGNIYISDSFNNRIRKITKAGVVTTIAGNGTAGYVDGAGATAQFYGPQGLAVDAQGNVFVADFGNNVIRKISTTGVVSTVAGNPVGGYLDGAATVAKFSSPAAVAVDKQGNLFVADFNNNMIRKITSAGVVSTVAGVKSGGYSNVTINTTTGVNAAFKNPDGIVLDAAGNIFVADLGNNAIREITTAGVVTTIAGGPGQAALVGNPGGLAMDAAGNIFITDENGRVIELTAARVLYDLAGTSGLAGFVDGSGVTAKFSTPQGIGVDASGNIYVADFNNNRIRKVLVVNSEVKN